MYFCVHKGIGNLTYIINFISYHFTLKHEQLQGNMFQAKGFTVELQEVMPRESNYTVR